MNELYWDERSIALWQQRTFHATKRMQLLKSMSEAQEYYDAEDGESKMMELADFYITLCFIAYIRKDPAAKLVLELIRQLPYWGKLDDCIQKKMQINLGRKWYKTHTGEVRHVEDDKTAFRRRIDSRKAESDRRGYNGQRYYKKESHEAL